MSNFKRKIIRRQFCVDVVDSIIRIVAERRVGVANFVGKTLGRALLPYISRYLAHISLV